MYRGKLTLKKDACNVETLIKFCKCLFRWHAKTVQRNVHFNLKTNYQILIQVETEDWGGPKAS